MGGFTPPPGMRLVDPITNYNTTAPLTWHYNNVAIKPPEPQFNYVTYDNQFVFDTGTTTTINNNPGKSMTTGIKTARIKAGFVGQVVTSSAYSIEQAIVWESKPKKTLRKAEKAARKAQLRAVERSFE